MPIPRPPLALCPQLRLPLAVLAFMALLSCQRKPPLPQPDPANIVDGKAAAEVTAHTNGMVSTSGRIRVVFSRKVVKAPGPAVDGVISFDPPLAGSAHFGRGDELEFTPRKPLPQGQTYQVKVSLKPLAVAGSWPFEFEFATLKQSAALNVDGVFFKEGPLRREAHIEGRVTTTDVADTAAVERGLNVDALGATVTWQHEPDHKDHRFSINGLVRQVDDKQIKIFFDATAIAAEGKQDIEQTIPGLNNFTALSARAVQEGDRRVELHFSDALASKQNLRGLISVENVLKVRLVVRDNVVEVYGTFANEVTLKVSPGIANDLGMKLKEGSTFAVTFDRLKPQARFLGEGVIFPTSENLKVPIETANLRQVTVEALRVPGKNLPQFFQVNRHRGDRELKRVGRVVWKRTFELGSAKDLSNTWTRHGLDISNLIRQEGSGFLRLRLSFNRNDTLYDCGSHSAVDQAASDLVVDDSLGNWNDEAESSYWDGVGGDYWDMYENRDNPCHAAYYRHPSFYGDNSNDDKNSPATASQNIFITDVGVLAKRGGSGEFVVVVTDLKSAQPRVGAQVTLLDFQQQVVASGRTDVQGQVRLRPTETPFLVMAEQQSDTGFLRLDAGDALSTAHFDTGGAAVTQGLKGYFYGERGIWRPGDDIFLTFVLLDRDGTLPSNHPLHFSLVDPAGKVIRRVVRARSRDGFNLFKLKTTRDAETGNYTAKVDVGGATFTKVLRVEAIRPNRMKVNLQAKNKMLRPNVPIDATLSAAWLHGAPADGLEAKVEVKLVSGTTAFARHQEYRFDDPTAKYEAESETLFDDTLDSKGKANLDFSIPYQGPAPGLLTAQFSTRVFEEGGGYSVDRHELPFSPYERYVGLRLPPGDKTRGMLLTDQKHKARVVVVDESGSPVKDAVTVKFALYKIGWRWWWESGDDDELNRFRSSQSLTPLATGVAKTQLANAEWEFEIKYPDWGRYLILATDDNGGHTAGWVFYCDWPGWAGRARKDQPGGAQVLSLATDKRSYNIGEEASLTIPAATAGRALVSLENGSRVLQASWVELKGKPIQHKIKVTADMAPNVYAHVTLLQPHVGRGNDLPLRLYGISPIRVVDPASKLEPVLTAPDEFAPAGVARVAVGEANGRPMTYTLAVVDEGLLGLTRFRTPNPWNDFYAREALGVTTWDAFDDVAGAHAGRYARLLAVGGGEDEEAPEDDGPRSKKRANRFPPMVVFAGPFALEAGATQQHALQLPPYVGAVRVMVVAGQGQAFGAIDKEVPVRKPLVVLADLPRVLGPGEELTLPVVVFALDKSVSKADVLVKSDGNISVTGPAQKTVSFKGPGDELVPFKLKIGDGLGTARVTVLAKQQGGKQEAEHTIEIDVRHPGTAVTRVFSRHLKQGETWSLEKMPTVGVAGTNDVTLEASRVPPLDLERQLGYLIRYPHGCAEQVTSAAFPQVYLPALMELDPGKAFAVENHVKAAIETLQRYQNPSGGFGYWVGHREAHDWSTSWVGHFLLEAQRAGYRVPAPMLSSWKNHQQEAARVFAPGDGDLMQAYRLYTLALAGSAALPAMNRLRETQDLSPAARWRLAAAYQLAGQTAAAQSLVAAAPVEFSAASEGSEVFPSPLRERAMVLEALISLKDSRAPEVAGVVSQELASDARFNTQATAFALVAMSRWVAGAAQSGRLTMTARVGSTPALKIDASKPLARLPLLAAGDVQVAAPLVIQNESGDAWVRLVVTGLPPPGKDEASAHELNVKVAYEDREGQALDISKIAQGTDVKIKVTVGALGGNYQHLALTHVLPSGFEVVGEPPAAGRLKALGLNHQDIRDDRVLSYFDLRDKTHTIELLAHAAYPGRYYLPPVHVEAMYAPAVHARTKGRWITVLARKDDQP